MFAITTKHDIFGRKLLKKLTALRGNAAVTYSNHLQWKRLLILCYLLTTEAAKNTKKLIIRDHRTVKAFHHPFKPLECVEEVIHRVVEFYCFRKLNL